LAEDRDEQGRFVDGNPGGPGNPYARQVAALRRELMDAVTPEDLREVVEALVTAAKAGDVTAARILLDRLLGPPVAADLIARIEELEELIGDD
jgi:hypothetical protein